MDHPVDRYAYLAEAGLSHFADAHLMAQEPLGRERLACGLFARAARCALAALSESCAVQAQPATLNLAAPVVCLDHYKVFGRQLQRAFGHARRLSQVLILDEHDAGRGYLVRDLFDVDDVQGCEEAARFFIDLCCRRLLRCDWEQALIRFLPFRDSPMTNTTLWQRRGRPALNVIDHTRTRRTTRDAVRPTD